ncbi:MAG TPA: PadR family transcriptional regulator [Vicinamibacterales bacterium]|nr:PadR family transcriptional regulator [Vicinamibacterales bacterium]
MDIYLLLALADGPAHGYAVMQAIRQRSAGTVSVGTGSFYRRLSALIDARLVEEADRPRQDDPRRGAYYRITAAGRRALSGERDRLAALVAAVDGLRPASRRGRT